MTRQKSFLSRGVAAFACFVLAITVSRCGKISDILQKVPTEIPNADRFLEEKPAITTSLKDGVTEVPFLDDFNPQRFLPLTRLKRGPHNGFLMSRPGLFEFEARSYCLNAGTYAPTKGDGYVYAPLAGPRAAVIRTLAQNSVDHPEIPQRDVQALIWAILARSKISETSRNIRAAAAKLLSPQDIRDLNGDALGTVSRDILERAVQKLPSAPRQIIENQARLREMLSKASASYEDLEKVAILTGVHEPGEGSREVPRGRWSYHPDGYFVRYLPSGYSRMRMELAVPPPFTIERDAKGRIAAISDNIGNRIESDYDDSVNPVAIQGDPNVRGYAFRAIRFVRPYPMGPEFVKVQRAEWKNVGWTLVGQSSGKGNVESPPAQFPGLKQRYQEAVALDGEVAGVVEGVMKLRGAKDGQAGSKRTGQEVADLGHYAAALKSALGESIKGKEEWILDHALLGKLAWQRSFCELAGVKRTYGVREQSLMAASANSDGYSSGQSDDPCDEPPRDPADSPEQDPSDGAANPGNTAGQRLLPSAAGADPGKKDKDCSDAQAVKKELEDILDAFTNTQPKPGEKGFDYKNRVQKQFGWGDPGGAKAPMETHIQCVIMVNNEAYYRSKPDVIRQADCAHEKVHQAKCRWARDHAAGGYEAWMSDAQNYQQNEKDAYQAGIQELDNWLKKNGCK